MQTGNLPSLKPIYRLNFKKSLQKKSASREADFLITKAKILFRPRGQQAADSQFDEKPAIRPVAQNYETAREQSGQKPSFGCRPVGAFAGGDQAGAAPAAASTVRPRSGSGGLKGPVRAVARAGSVGRH
jgi:hypothetical protein